MIIPTLGAVSAMALLVELAYHAGFGLLEIMGEWAAAALVAGPMEIILALDGLGTAWLAGHTAYQRVIEESPSCWLFGS